MLFDSWVLDWFALLNLATLSLAALAFAIGRLRNRH